MSLSYSLQELAEHLGAELHGPPELRIDCVCSAEAPVAGGITFVENAPQAARLSADRLGALVVPSGVSAELPYLSCKKPRLAFARLLEFFYPSAPVAPGVHPSARVHPTAAIDPGSCVGPLCLVGEGCHVETGARLKARVLLGAGTHIGANCRIEANVWMDEGCRLGSDCYLEGSVRLEAGVTLGRRVYVGSRTVVRAGVQVGSGSKIDNLAVLGAGSVLGDHCILVGQTLVGERSRLGRYVVLGAQVVILDDIEVADLVQVAGRSVVEHSLLEPKQQWGGDPAQPLKQELKERALRARSLEAYEKLRSYRQ